MPKRTLNVEKAEVDLQPLRLGWKRQSRQVGSARRAALHFQNQRQTLRRANAPQRPEDVRGHQKQRNFLFRFQKYGRKQLRPFRNEIKS